MLFPKPTKQPKKKSYRIGPGKKTLEWESAKPKLKSAFSMAGLTYCEVGVLLCEVPEYYELMQEHRHNFFMTFAHGDKRRNLRGNELYTLVVLSCLDCHNLIEKMPREQMRLIVETIIRNRKVQPIL